MTLPGNSFPRRGFAAALIVVSAVAAGPLSADVISINSSRDNTLYQYVPNNPDYEFNSNGSGNFFSAGRTYSTSDIRRGLIYFDLPSVAPGSRVVPGTLSLQLTVVDVAKKDGTVRPYWVVPVTGVNELWGEGASATTAGVSGAGSGAPAEAGDATWFHTGYNPAVHDQTTFNAGDPGFWNAQGALGNTPLDPWTLYGDPTAYAGDLYTTATFSSAGMEADINAWLADPTSNFGWIVLGDETISSTTASSNRGFATREHDIAGYRPLLSFDTAVPEPSAIVLLATGLVALFGFRLRGRA